MMQIGVCSSIDSLPKILGLGADYLETAMFPVADMSDADFQKALDISRRYPGKIYSANCMFPGDRIHLNGPLYQPGSVTAYLEKLFFRMDQLGIKHLVFGSSAAKNLPEGFDRAKGYSQLVEALQSACEIAADFGQEILVEPLNKAECNIINSVSEAAALARDVKCSNIFAMADFYHCCQVGETYGDLAPDVPFIRHVHIASPVLRGLPVPGDGADYAGFISFLKENGYEGNISLETRENGNSEKLVKAIGYLKSIV